MAAPSAPPPSVGAVAPTPIVPARREDKVAPAPVAVPVKDRNKDRKGSVAAPGFSFK